MVQKSAKLILLIGPSGVGKGTILHKILKENQNLNYSVSVTTRAKRAGELEGINYFFTSQKKFDELIRQGRFLEWAEYAGQKYGTLKETVLEYLEKKQSIVLEIELEGAKALYKKKLDLEKRFIFIYPPSLKELEKRLSERKTESLEEIALRIKTAQEELANYEKINWEYSFKVVNEVLEETCQKISQIIND